MAAFFVFGGDDDEPVADDRVTLESISDVGANPWTDNLDSENPDLERIEVLLDDVPSVDEDDFDGLGVPIDGDEGGLFGGLRGEIACDKDEIAGQLTDDDDKSAAFAEVQGIDAGDVEDFIGDLTGVLVRKDVRLADHGFVDGQAERFEAVLERGTSVLVDDEGVPRVRCASGSPLVAARSTGETEDFGGAEWPGFDKNRVIVIEPSDAGDAFVLVDNDNEDVFNRPVGSAGDDDTDADPEVACAVNPDSLACLLGGEPVDPNDPTTTEPELGTGDVQFTLRWDSGADMDIAVTDPTGARIDFSNRTAPTGGELDVDANASCNADAPVENVFWPPGTAPVGTYTVEVTLFNSCDLGPQAFELSAVLGGQSQTETGTLNTDREVQTFTFTL